MYKIKKVLNHNTVITIDADKSREFLIMGKGIGFCRKPGEAAEVREDATVYSLQEHTERGDASELAVTISPLYLEIANEILNHAEEVFGEIDRTILFPMADHIEFAVNRIENHIQIINPLTDDIRVLFHGEYQVAESARSIVWKKTGIHIDEDEIGYIALHIHSAIVNGEVSQAMQIAQAVRESVSLVEQEIGMAVDVTSLSYNRLVSHIRYMVARVLKGEKLNLNINDYMSVRFPEAYQIAERIDEEMGRILNCRLDSVETGYLAMHIARLTLKNGQDA